MKGIGLSRMVYELEFKLSADFTFQNTHVGTITSKKYKRLFPNDDDFPDTLHGIKLPPKKERNSPFGYLLIDSTFDLEEYDSLTQGSAKIRPQLLVVHGILSFLTKQMFISFQNFSSSQYIVDCHITSRDQNKLRANKINYDSDLNKIISAISSASQEKKVLIYTLFERWRKALYLENESEESYIHFRRISTSLCSYS